MRSGAKAIFLLAIEKETNQERQRFLDEACVGDPELRRRVEELLSSFDEAGNFMEDRPAAIFRPTVTHAAAADVPGTRIGPYKLRERIGEGGFGVVFVAEQEIPVRRKVALKVIKPGMDTKDVVARFEAERQALALMDHPNVAKVLDGGATDNGRPYFVMELVHGVAITKYCDNNSLSTRERLEVFVNVCFAVQHAHQKGIIHRDLKPNNILVTLHDGRPVPKVIDFGVSKALSQQLTEKTIYTAYGQMIGTPVYMSPEQAEMSGLGIDTRSDIYSLGVLLYELLTGKTPLDVDRLRATGYAEMLRLIREEEPLRPSMKLLTLEEESSIIAKHRRTDPKKLRQGLRRELDWIVMKALEKDRNRRYETANDIAADIERHLNDEAIAACPPSAAYKLRKFVRRHRGSVIAAASLLLVLCLGLAGTSLGLIRARAAQKDAMIERDIAIDARREEADARSEAEQSRKEAVKARNAERRLAFRMAFDHGLAQCAQGRVGRGMHWLARALELAPSDETAMRRVILANLNAWSRELHSLEALLPHDQAVLCAAFSPDGKLILTGSSDHTARLWDQAGTQIAGLLHEGDVHGVAFNPDGSRILTANYDGTARLWDTNTGEVIQVLPHPVLVPAAVFSPDGSWFFTGSSNGTVAVWNADDGHSIGEPLKHPQLVHDLAISSDGSKILTACYDKIARVWDLTDPDQPACLAKLPHDTEVFSADFRTTDGTQVVTASSDGSVYLWDVASRKIIHGRRLHRGVVHHVRVSPDGSRVLTASLDTTARLWDPDANVELGAPIEHQAAVQGAAFSTEGSRIVTGCDDNAARIWRPALGHSVRITITREDPRRQKAVYTSDGRHILTAWKNRTSVVRDTATGDPVGMPLPLVGDMNRVAVCARKSMALTAGRDGRPAQLWDLTNGKPVFEPFHDNPYTVAFSPDGGRLLTGSADGTLRLRSAGTGDLIRALELGVRIWGVAFSPNGKQIAVAGSDKMVRLFDANLQTVPLPLQGHKSTVYGIAFSGDGTRLVTGSDDNTARVWNAKTGKQLTSPMAHRGPVDYALAFSPDGKAVVTGCDDRTVQIWDVATAKPIGPALTHEASIGMVSFGYGGSQIITGTELGTVGVWDVSILPLEDNLERIRVWLAVATGTELDANTGELRSLDRAAWQQRCERLSQLGGPPSCKPVAARHKRLR